MEKKRRQMYTKKIDSVPGEPAKYTRTIKGSRDRTNSECYPGAGHQKRGDDGREEG